MPHVFPKQPHTENSPLSTPYQALGARCVNYLSSKMVLALFPPNSPFFRITMEEEVQDAIASAGIDEKELLESLAKIERRIIAELESSNYRPVLSLCIKHLLVTGNGLLDVSKEGVRFFPLHSYVVNRDPLGKVVTMILKERVAVTNLPDNVKVMLDQKDASNSDKELDLYTCVKRDGAMYRYWQEIGNKEIPGSAGTYKATAPRFIPLRWNIVAGEDYGRGMVEEYLGDFSALDALSRDLLKASAAAAKVIFLRNPGAILRAKELEEAESGDVLDGRENDVRVLQLEKFNDFRITLERINALTDALSKAFLLNTSIQRSGERVTAEEIRFMAQELEDSLGGVYSLLSSELQAPLIQRFKYNLETAGKIPTMSQKDVRLTITTGLDALGRGHDLNKLISYLKLMAEVVGPQTVAARLNFSEVNSRASVGFGIETEGLWKTEEEMQQEQQSATMNKIAEGAVPPMLTQAVKGMQQ